MDPVTLVLIVAALYIYAQKVNIGSTVEAVISTVTKAGKFVTKQYSNAKHLQDETGIDPVVTLLQAAHESNFGTSGLATRFHNLFGIKPSQDWLKQGKPLAHFDNVASEGGAAADFKAYSSDLESMRDWAALLKRLYPLAYSAAQQGDLDLFFDGLNKGLAGAYATDPNYKTSALALLPSLKSALPEGIA